jgi:hypothetical protein
MKKILTVFACSSGWCAFAVLWGITGYRPGQKIEPYLVFVCGQDPDPNGLAYHDCTSHPLEVKSEEECKRLVAFGGWTLTTGPVTRAMREDKAVMMTCVQKNNVRDRHVEPKKPDSA